MKFIYTLCDDCCKKIYKNDKYNFTITAYKNRIIAVYKKGKIL